MQEICLELGRQHEVHVLTSGAGELPSVEKHPESNVTVHRAPVFGRSARATASFLSMFHFTPAAIKLASALMSEHKFDVINTWFAIPSGIAGGWIARKYKIPHLLTVIGGDIYDPSKWYSPHSFFPSALGVKWAIKRADALVAISSDIANRTCDYFKYSGKIPVIPLGIKTPEYTAVDREQLEMNADAKYIVTLGRQVRRKDYPTLLNAMARLNDSNVHLIMIGDGPEQGNLSALATDLGIRERVHFKGFLPENVKYQILANSNVFLLASLHEGFGVVYLEAMYCGLPVIASDEGGQVDLLEQGKTGYLVPIGGTDKMAEALQSILTDDSLAKGMGEYNTQHVKNFAISKLAQLYDDKYQSLIADHNN